MSGRFRLVVASAAVLAGLLPLLARAQVTGDPPFQRPDAIVDLRTHDGAGLVKATWKFHEARIVSGTNRAPGPDLRASGAPVATQDLEPRGRRCRLRRPRLGGGRSARRSRPAAATAR